MTESAENDARCSCGNRFDGDNLCMKSACQWEGLEDQLRSAENDAARLAAVELWALNEYGDTPEFPTDLAIALYGDPPERGRRDAD